jgi:hypothetical protein
MTTGNPTHVDHLVHALPRLVSPPPVNLPLRNILQLARYHLAPVRSSLAYGHCIARTSSPRRYVLGAPRLCPMRVSGVVSTSFVSRTIPQLMTHHANSLPLHSETPSRPTIHAAPSPSLASSTSSPTRLGFSPQRAPGSNLTFHRRYSLQGLHAGAVARRCFDGRPARGEGPSRGTCEARGGEQASERRAAQIDSSTLRAPTGRAGLVQGAGADKERHVTLEYSPFRLLTVGT